jgi:hypothetical protein
MLEKWIPPHDGGGIYTLGGIQSGTVISENHLHDSRMGPYGQGYPISMIYLDNHTSRIVVRDNVVKDGKAEQRNGSRGKTLQDNVQGNPAVEANAGVKPGCHPGRITR